MTTMTDKAAEKIAEQTIKKFDNAGRYAMMLNFVNVTDGEADLDTVTTDALAAKSELIGEAVLRIAYDLFGENLVKAAKQQVKDVKQLKKEKKRGSKH